MSVRVARWDPIRPTGGFDRESLRQTRLRRTYRFEARNKDIINQMQFIP